MNLPIRHRQLEDAAGRCFATVVEGRTLTQTSGRRATTKNFDTPEQALAQARKEELSRLRKGFVGRHQGLQLHLQAPYTGAMALVFQNDTVVTNRFSDEAQCDQLQTYNLQGQLMRTDVVSGLVWQLEQTRQELVARVDHSVVFRGEVLAQNPRPASFLSVQAGRLACYDAPFALVRDLQGGELLRFECQPDLYGGHSQQMAGCLSPDGQRLALCYRTGHLELFDLQTGTHCSWSIPTSLVQPLAFVGDTLVLAESYSHWRLSLLQTRDGSHSELRRTDFASDAVVYDGHVYVTARDLLEQITLDDRMVACWPVDYAVKRSRVAVSDQHGIALRTDLGCLLLISPG